MYLRHFISAFALLALASPPLALAEEKGILRITTEPGNAKIYVDGERKGSSPNRTGQSIAIRLPEGEYRIEAIIPINEDSEHFGEKTDVFVGADTIQSFHIKLAERLTGRGERLKAEREEADRTAKEKREQAERIAKEKREKAKRIEKDKREEAERIAAAKRKAVEQAIESRRKEAQRLENELILRYSAIEPGKGFRECTVCPQMIVIPTGDYVQGSPHTENGRKRGTEETQRPVSISHSFALSETEVTFAQWQACVDSHRCRQPDDEGWGKGQRPVINVSWTDVRQYISWLNGQVGGDVYRLPSESEWEYAARAGTTSPFWTGETILKSQANYARATLKAVREKTVPVRSFLPNAFGLYDVTGNVWEWTQDCFYRDYPHSTSNGSSASGDSRCIRVRRGGGWSSSSVELRSANRFYLGANRREDAVGFRLARTLQAR